MKVHLTNGLEGTICGLSDSHIEAVFDKKVITCKRCKKTQMYKKVEHLLKRDASAQITKSLQKTTNPNELTTR